jgi:hypothetical protein
VSMLLTIYFSPRNLSTPKLNSRLKNEQYINLMHRSKLYGHVNMQLPTTLIKAILWPLLQQGTV